MRTHITHIRHSLIGVLALTAVAFGLIAWHSAAAQVNDPVIGPGIPQVGSNAPKSAISSTKAGSVLFFPKYTSDSVNPANVNTLISLTNTNSRDSVTARVFFVHDCQVESIFINLAGNQTRTLLASSENPGKTGYLVVVAVNSQGTPTQFNWLIGSASIRDAIGHEATYNAIGVAKRTAGAVSINPGDTVAAIRFNDTDYDRLPQLIAIDNIQNQDPNAGPNPASAVRTDVAIFSPQASLNTGGAQALKVTAVAYDQSSRSYPQVIDTLCGLNGPVTGIWTTPPLNSFIQPGRPGWGTFAATIDSTPVPLLGLSLSDGVSNPQRNARPMQVLSRLDSFTMSMPIAPPPIAAIDVLTADQPEAVGGSQGASESKPGSVLIFPRFTSGAFGSSGINITNTHPTQRVRVRVFFVGVADTPSTTETIIPLNANQTTTINQNALTPTQKGWVIAIAIDDSGLPLNHNFLIGSCQVSEQSGQSSGYTALAVAKNSPGSVPRSGDVQTSDILFNDQEYDRLPATLAFNGLPSQIDNSTILGYARPPANLTDPPNTRGSVQVTAIDEFLSQFSAAIGGLEVRLITVRPSLLLPPITNTILKGRRGWLKLTPGTPIFAWTNNSATAPFIAQGTSSTWTGGLGGGSTLHILASADTFLLKTTSNNPNNQAPTANFEPIPVYNEARGSLGTIVRLDGRLSSDPNPFDQLTFRWLDNDVLISTAPVSDFRLGIGVHFLKLIVTDSSALSSEPRTAIVEVRDLTPPLISGIPSNVTKITGSSLGATITFPLPVAYDMVDGFVTVTASRDSGSVFPVGRTTVTFTARDSSGNESRANMDVVVNLDVATSPQVGGVAGNRLPYMNNLNDQYVVIGKTRSFTLQAFEDEGDPVVFALQNAPSYVRIENLDPVARRATLVIAPSQGSQVLASNVRVLAIDSKGGVFSTLPFRIQISDVENDETGSGQGPGGGGGGGGGGGTNRPPVAIAGALPASVPANTKQGLTIQLDGSQSSDPDNDPLSYTWRDGSQVIAQGVNPTVTLAIGQHSISLTVSDGKGGTGVAAAQSVQVLPRPLSVTGVSPARIAQFSTSTITISGTGFNQGAQVRFDCSSFCQGGSQISVTVLSVEEDTIVVTAKTSQRTPLGNRDCIVTNPSGETARLARGSFVSP